MGEVGSLGGAEGTAHVAAAQRLAEEARGCLESEEEGGDEGVGKGQKEPAAVRWGA